MKTKFKVLSLAGIIMAAGIAANAQATTTVDLTTCAQVSNLTSSSVVNYVVTGQINCTTPIVINVPNSTLTYAPGSTLNSSVSTAINAGEVSTGTPIIGSTGIGVGGTISIGGSGSTNSIGTGTATIIGTSGTIGISNGGGISVGTITSTGTPIPISTTTPVKASAYLYDYDTGGSLRPNTRNVAMVLSLENTTVGVNSNLTALSISNYSAVDLTGKEVNLSLPATIALNTPFNGSVYGKQKYVLGPYSVRPLSEAQISGGLVVNMMISWGGTSLDVSTVAPFNQTNNYEVS